MYIPTSALRNAFQDLLVDSQPTEAKFAVRRKALVLTVPEKQEMMATHAGLLIKLVHFYSVLYEDSAEFRTTLLNKVIFKSIVK